MSNIIHKLFCLAMDELPYVPTPDRDKAEEALEEILGKENKPLLTAYADAWDHFGWDTAEHIFYIALSLGIELGTLTPSAGTCRR